MYREGKIAEPPPNLRLEHDEGHSGLHVTPANKDSLHPTRPPSEILVAACISCRRGNLYPNPTGFSPLGVPGGRVRPAQPARWAERLPYPHYPPQRQW
jgi:hypothetical protein